MKNIINRIKNDKLLFFLSILIIGLFLVLIIRITYSYLAASINEAKGNVTLSSDTTDKFEFIKGEDLSLNVTSTTLPEGGGNYAKSTTYSASLLANSTTNEAEETYFVYFNIPTNTINYIEENTPEVILTISQGDNEITNINGLTYGTYNGVSGFDITNKSGSFNIVSDYLITSNSSENATIQDWTFTLTYLNQGYDQSANYGNSMNVEIIMSREEKELTLAQLCNGLTLTECITTKVYDASKVDETGLYYHDTNLANGAEDNSYRYSGANPNNYVCFGSDAETCPSDNLYRIIGVFGSEVKLIKADYLSTEYGAMDNYEKYMGDSGTYKGNMSLSDIGVYAWDTKGTYGDNTWSTSDIKNTLNTTYLSSLSSTWQNKIATYSWNVGGISMPYLTTAKQYFDAEVESSSSSIIDSMKIGLIYVSDYGFAASNDSWTLTLNNYNSVTSSNWLYLGNYEWIITPDSSYSFAVFYVNYHGYLDNDLTNCGYAVRPVFYLNSNITYVSGEGTQSNPIRIN